MLVIIIIGPPLLAEGTYKFMPVRCLVRSFVRDALFSELARYFFSNFLHEVRGSYMLKSDEARFFGKNLIFEFWAKKGSKIGFFEY